MRRAGWAIAIVAGVLALAHAISRTWLCDDAFISFRYADHLAHGHGLVFNVGERVEGDTNFLWTLWIAVGRLFGASATGWAIVWGLVAYAGTIALVARRSLQLDDIPSAVVFAAAHVGWAEFATSGLETSAFTLCAFAGYVLVCPESDEPASRRRIAAAGAVFALASLTRPDGVLFGAVAGAWLLAQKRVRDGLVLAAAFAIVWLPPTVWRISYYGDFFPNTYYAKSAWLPWWSQGRWYGLWYLERYLPFVLVPFALLTKARKRAALELAMVAVYTLYVMRVGGDFMFARLFVPLTPFLVLLLQRAIGLCRPHMRIVLTVAAAASLKWMPMPPRDNLRGIFDERHFYAIRSWAVDSDAHGAVLARQLRGLPVVLGFSGAAARLVYRSDVPTAIETETGLTDPEIAHQPLMARGRVGHEKHAQPAYLFSRGVDFVNAPFDVRGLSEELPHLEIDLGEGARLVVIAWRPEIMNAVLARGATFPDLADQLGKELARWSEQKPAVVAREMDLFMRALQSLPSADGGDRSRPR
ncbi:MAG: hypothetical protein JO257_37905 [Deltaproteobacteria bacterium]|nr:hypothetical protein [Deltaproteobacteria bacterium]